MRILLLSVIMLLPITSVSFAAKTALVNEKYDKIKVKKTKNKVGYAEVIEAKGPGETGDGSPSFMDMKKPVKNDK